MACRIAVAALEGEGTGQTFMARLTANLTPYGALSLEKKNLEKTLPCEAGGGMMHA